MVILFNWTNQVSELLKLFVTYNPEAFTAIGHWSYSDSCNELLCAHFRSSNLFHTDYCREMTTWSYTLKGIPIDQSTPPFFASWIIKAFHSCLTKWRWAPALWILLDSLHSCISSLSFTYWYMRNTNTHVLLAQTNVICSPSFQEPLLFSFLKHSSKFNSYMKTFWNWLYLFYLLIFYNLSWWGISKIHKSKENSMMSTSSVVMTPSASTVCFFVFLN